MSHDKPDILSIEEQLRQLYQEYADELPGKLVEIEASWHKLQQTPTDRATLAQLHRMVHSLAGSGASFGFPRERCPRRRPGRPDPTLRV